MHRDALRFALFLLLTCVLGSSAYADTSSSAYTSFQKIAESLYPSSQMSKLHRRPTSSEKEWIDQAMSTTIEQIEAIDAEWYTKIAASFLPQEFSDSLGNLRESPVWICLDQCSCPEKSPLGCAQGKFYGEVFGTVLTLKACLFEDGKRCGYGAGKNKNELLFEALAKSAAQIVFYKTTLKRTGYDKKMVSSYDVLMESVRELGSIQTQCRQSPEKYFSASAFSSLKKTGRLRGLGSFQDLCAQKLVKMFQITKMPRACALALDRKLWEAHWRFGILVESSVKALRCEGVCERVTCGDDNGARPIGFAGHWYLSVPEGVCEGENPTNSQAFVRRTLDRYLNAETKQMTSEKREALVSQCEAGFRDRL